MYVETVLILHHNVGTKRNLVNGKFVFLWHKHVGHISRGRMERLIKNEILHDLDFMNLNIYMDCIKGKQTKHTKKRDQEGMKMMTNLRGEKITVKEN